jgi:PPOX class probable F420-dependent enzyme
MPPAPVPPSVAAFLAEPNHAVVATLRPDGSPHSTATWYDWEDGRVLLSMDHSRARLRWVRADPRIALTVLDRDDWYRHVSLVGTIEEMHDDDGLRDIDRLAVRFTGEPYKSRDSPRVSAWMRVERWHGWDSSGDRKVTAAAWGDDDAAAEQGTER